MDTILISTLMTLAGKWQTEADDGRSAYPEDIARRVALRECADTLRMLCEARFEDCPHAAMLEDLRAEVKRCFDLAQRMDSLAPGVPGSFTGTPSERIARQLAVMWDEVSGA